MKKNISAVLLTLACFSALSATAFADGPIGRAIDGIGRAGRDIADGAGDAVSDVVDGADDAMSDATDGETSGDDTTGGDTTDSDTTGSDTTSDADSEASDTSDTTSSDDSAVSSDPESSESDAASVDSSGAVGGITATNPGTGVTYGLTAGAAVLAAVGVVAAAARKNK